MLAGMKPNVSPMKTLATAAKIVSQLDSTQGSISANSEATFSGLYGRGGTTEVVCDSVVVLVREAMELVLVRVHLDALADGVRSDLEVLAVLVPPVWVGVG